MTQAAAESRSARNLDNAAIFQTEAKRINGWRFHAKYRKRRADLAPMLGSVVQHLRKVDAQWSVPLEPVVGIDLSDHGLRIEGLVDESGPTRPEILHCRPELRKSHLIRPDEGATLAP